MRNIIALILVFIQRYIWSYEKHVRWCEKLNIIRKIWIETRFKYCHKTVRIGRIDNISGMEFISINENTGFGDGLTLTAWGEYNGVKLNPKLLIGKNCWFGLYNHLSCTNKIVIGDGFLSGKWVTIVDNDHGNTDFESLSMPPVKRPIVSKGPVVIGKNVWVGDKATILSGVTIGEGAVIAANSVVTRDVPAFCVVAGNPAKVIKNSNN